MSLHAHALPAPPSPPRLPENYLPTDEELVALVRRSPGISLKEICRQLWPGLPWHAENPIADSATADLRVFPVGKGTVRATTALYLRDRLQDLVTQGVLMDAPRRRDESDATASLTYVVSTFTSDE